MNQRGFTLVIIPLAVALFIVIVLAGVFLNTRLKNSTLNLAKNSVLSLKTLEFDAPDGGRFSLEYPSDTIPQISYSSGHEIRFTKGKCDSIMIEGDPVVTCDQLIISWDGYYSDWFNSLNSQPLQIGNNQYLKTPSKYPESELHLEATKLTPQWTDKLGTILVFMYDNSNQNRQEFNQIISSLKFVSNFTKRSNLTGEETGPDDFSCYPDELFQIPDQKLIGLSCSQEGNTCTTENDQTLTYNTTIDQSTQQAVQSVSLADANNKIIGDAQWNTETAKDDSFGTIHAQSICKAPISLTTSKGSNNQENYIAYIGCIGYSGPSGVIDRIFKLNLTTHTAQELGGNFQHNSCNY